MEYQSLLYGRNTCSETFTLERDASGSEVEFLVGNWDGIFLLPLCGAFVPLQLEIRRTIAAYPRGKCASENRPEGEGLSAPCAACRVAAGASKSTPLPDRFACACACRPARISESNLRVPRWMNLPLSLVLDLPPD